MIAPSELSSLKEHFDIIVALLLVCSAGLLATALYIFNQINKTASSTLVIVERHTKEIARVYTCLGKICTAHNINHGQDLEC